MTTTTLTKQPPFLPRKRIERDAQCLLQESQKTGLWDGNLPIPIESILEFQLGLRLEIGDLREFVEIDDALGGLWFEDRLVRVDQTLDPEEYPDLEGRYRFTLAHEVGHWRLHRQWLESRIICRSGTRAREEWQADYFAASLLMPRPLVFEAWRNYSSHPMTFEQLMPQAFRDDLPDDDPELIVRMLNTAAEPLADMFLVSPMAMRIRLEELDLLLR